VRTKAYRSGFVQSVYEVRDDFDDFW
jgi:hypothetical protein